ncbi:MAG: Holliday junction resolvase RuvX [Planctomycetaceae bacterium]|nr:Holliday junction resolvase RuvX [Planctomycetaceae bacterium]
MTDPAATDFPIRGALIGVDHGTKRVGLAVSDAEQTMAMPLSTIALKSAAHDAPQFRRVAADYRAVGWVLGLPLHMQSGEEGTQAAMVRRFGDWLHATTGLPVRYWDERLSSSAAEAVLWSLGESPSQQKGRLDGLAAQHILQNYLRDGRTPT